MEADKTTGPSQALPASLRVDVKQADAHRPGRRPERRLLGHAGPAANEYKGSLYAKADSAAMGPVTVSLVGNDTGKAVATAPSPA